MTVPKFTGIDLVVCDLLLNQSGGGVEMTSVLASSLLLHTKPHGAEWTSSNIKFNLHMTKDFGRKPNVDAAQCIEWIASLCRKLPSFAPSVSASPLSEGGDAQLIWPHALVHNLILPPGPLSEFQCKNDVFLLAISDPTTCIQKAFYSSKAAAFQLCQTTPKTYKWGTAAEV